MSKLVQKQFVKLLELDKQSLLPFVFQNITGLALQSFADSL
jgi:hypothetical protein